MRDYSLPMIAESLFNALANKQAIPPLSETFPSLTVEDAYRIQKHLADLHQVRGRRIIGQKKSG